MVSLNLTDLITVRLSDEGKAIYANHYQKLKDELREGDPYISGLLQTTPVVDSDGFMTMRVYEFMEIFDPYLCHGTVSPTVGGRIYFREEDVVDYG
ncbi:MAG: hypothetical protein LUD69_05900 [Oscillospiraceae bacterium]|nr:hypothetical protein [Oscillospiraceae bacterium]